MGREVFEWGGAFLARVADPRYVESLFDRLPDIVFSVKDRAGRYVAMSRACVERCGLAGKRQAIGKTAFDLFPAPMAARYAAQDERLFRTGKPIVDSLDLTLYPDRSAGWCISTKEPLRDANGRIIGLACVSKDLVEPSRAGFVDAAFARAIDHALEHFAEPLRVDALARIAGVSLAQFDRRMRRIFQLSSSQFLIKTRIDAAARLLAETEEPIAAIAQAAGYSDQSGLSRQFRAVTGLTPLQYRRIMRDA